MKVEIRIEELVLHGLSPHDARRVGEAVRGELARLVAERGLPASWARGADVARVDGGVVASRPPTSARALGAEIAGAVDRGWRR